MLMRDGQQRETGVREGRHEQGMCPTKVYVSSVIVFAYAGNMTIEVK